MFDVYLEPAGEEMNGKQTYCSEGLCFNKIIIQRAWLDNAPADHPRICQHIILIN
jgi:hypothetical protein